MAVVDKSSEQAGAENLSKYVDFDEFIAYQVKKTRSGIHKTDLLTAALVLGLMIVSYLLVFVLMDHWVVAGGFSYTARLIMLTGLVACSVGWGIWKIALPYARRINAMYAAREIEETYPDLKSTLLTWVDLKTNGRKVPQSILKAIERRAALEMSHQDVDQAIDRRSLLNVAYTLLAVVTLFAVYTFASPKKISTSIWRALFPTADVTVATTTRIVDVKPGHAEVLARSQVDVLAELEGKLPEEVTLFYSTADRRFVDEPVVMRRADTELPRYSALLAGENGRGLLQDVRYHIQAGDAKSPEYLLRVNQPPSAGVTEVAYDYPGYMNLDDQVQPGGNIDAWEGTKVTVRAQANMPLKSATILFSDSEDISQRGEEIPMSISDGVLLQATWTLAFRSDGTYPRFYRIQVVNEREQNDPAPALHNLKIRPDLAPEIRLIHPTSDIDMPANGIVPIAFEARDPDFLMRMITLKFEKLGEELPFSPRLFEGPPLVPAVKSTYRLNLEPFGLNAGDKLVFYLRAEDNMEPFGNRIGNVRQTPKVTINIVEPATPESVQEQLQAEEQKIEKLQEAQDQQENPDQPQEQMPAEDQPQEDPPQQDGQQQQGQNGQQGEQGTEGSSAKPRQGDQGGDSSSGARQGERSEDGTGQGKSAEGGEGQQQPGAGAGEKMPDQASDQQPGDGAGTPPGESGDQGSKSPQSAENTPSGKSGNGQNQRPSESGQGTPGQQNNQPSGPGEKRPDKAADDQALRDLLDWNKEQRDRQGDTPQDGNQGTEEKPGQEQQQPGTGSPEQSGGADQKQPGNDGAMPGEDGSRPKPPESQGQGQNPGGTGTADSRGSDPNGQPNQGTPDSPSQAPSATPGSEGTPGQEGLSPGSKESLPSQPGSDPGKPGLSPDEGMQPGMKSEPGHAGEPTGTKTPAQGEQPGSEGTSPPQPGEGTAQGKESDRKPTGETIPGQKPEQGTPSASDTAQKPNGQSGQPGQQGADPQGTPMNMEKPDGTPSGEGPPKIEPSPQGQGQQGQGQGEKMPQDGGASDQSGSSQQPPPAGQQGQGQQGQGQQGQGQQGQGQQGQGQQGQGQQGQGQQGQGQQGQGQQGQGQGQGEKMPQDGGAPDQSGSSQQPPPAGQQGQGQQGQGQQGQGQQGQGQQGQGQQGPPGGQSPSGGGGTAGGSAPAPGAGEGSGGEGTAPAPEALDLANKKKATSLALERLRDQMERGETPQELMDRLGFNEDDLKRFMQRLETRLADPGIDQSPEAEAARRQFDSLLRGTDYQSTGGIREGGDGPREASGGFGAASRPVPPEYRADERAYKKRLSGTEKK